MMQFYCAGRISEIAGIQVSNIYSDQEYVLIKHAVVWCNSSKVYEYLKPFPKNKESVEKQACEKVREIQGVAYETMD
jgi:hypothetical protein